MRSDGGSPTFVSTPSVVNLGRTRLPKLRLRESERERETERAVWGLNPCTIALVKERKTESLLSVKACFDILGSAAPFLHLC